MSRTTHAARTGALALAALVASACSDAISPPAASVAPPTLSRVGTVSSDRHVMEFLSGVPGYLAAQVAAKGGKLIRVDDGIGMAVT